MARPTLIQCFETVSGELNRTVKAALGMRLEFSEAGDTEKPSLGGQPLHGGSGNEWVRGEASSRRLETLRRHVCEN